MAQEGHVLGFSCSGGGFGSGGGGDTSIAKSSKKVKQKKVPQRGLGVAQLEKIRLQEQQKRESMEAANVFATSVVDSPSDIAQFLPIQCPKFRTGLPSLYSSMSMPPPMVTSLPSPNVMYRNAPNIEIRHGYSVKILKQLNGVGGEMGSQMILSPVLGTWPHSLSNGKYDIAAGEKQRLNHHEFGLEAQRSLSYESNTSVLPLPIVPQRSHQFQQITSLVNSFSGILQPSILNSQIEPPSNQSSLGDKYTVYTPLWSEEDKIIGVKRPYPFYLESLQTPSFNLSSHVASLSRSDELVSHSNGYIEPRSKLLREGPPSSSHLEVTTDKRKLNGDFLTLAPPVLNSKHEQPLDYLEDDQFMLDQEYAGRRNQSGTSGLVKKSFSFFPIKLRADQSVSNENGQKKGKN